MNTKGTYPEKLGRFLLSKPSGKKYLLGFYELDDPNGEEVKEDL
ncbi:hypothetical protein LEP1GSC050_1299 [Leptospira broomii serovar Hurstbridge str. 5399]|uniref:Uncharacterized protein n=1 Tax=Leptospira broomii serovar Hurstbridge str. 5399 TaxID=1049789 RepID=T0F6Z3_9LEPT|nr:hypothetical protein LEP1GSC050_1299 [Leptospira broomii serovar Hurstbridge str. 5399]